MVIYDWIILGATALLCLILWKARKFEYVETNSAEQCDNSVPSKKEQKRKTSRKNK